MTNEPVYIVVDIESDGPAPGLHSMLSIAAVATTADNEKDSFYEKIAPLPGMMPDTDTHEWWQAHPDALNEVRTDQREALDVTTRFVAWVKLQAPEPIFVANPIALDYAFVGWYMQNLIGENPFIGAKNTFRTLDIRSYIAGKFGLDFSAAGRRSYPAELAAIIGTHNHRAIDDAKGYAALLRALLNWDDKPNPYRAK